MIYKGVDFSQDFREWTASKEQGCRLGTVSSTATYNGPFRLSRQGAWTPQNHLVSSGNSEFSTFAKLSLLESWTILKDLLSIKLSYILLCKYFAVLKCERVFSLNFLFWFPYQFQAQSTSKSKPKPICGSSDTIFAKHQLGNSIAFLLNLRY